MRKLPSMFTLLVMIFLISKAKGEDPEPNSDSTDTADDSEDNTATGDDSVDNTANGDDSSDNTANGDDSSNNTANGDDSSNDTANGGDSSDNNATGDDSTDDTSDGGGTDNASGGTEETEGVDFPSAEIHLDPLESCYCPGDNSVSESLLFKDKPADYKALLAVIAERRREAHLNFTMSVIPESVEAVERSKLPTAAILQDMFPDLGDGFVVKSYVESLSKITLKAVNDLKNLTATKMLQRLATSKAIRETVSKFDYSSYQPPPPATEPPADSSAGTEEEAQTGDGDTADTADTGESSDDEATDNQRKKRLVITSTTQVPPRVDVVYVVPEKYGYGVVALNATETLLNDSQVCHTCTPATLKRRKFLYFTTLFEDAWADVTTDEFKTKKIELEKAVDDLFFEKMSEYGISQKMTDAGDPIPGIPLIKGYMGCVVLSLFESTSSSLGAGKRRKRGFREGGLGTEVEISFRSPTVSDEDIEVSHILMIID